MARENRQFQRLMAQLGYSQLIVTVVTNEPDHASASVAALGAN
jgi:hypothetical protein